MSDGMSLRQMVRMFGSSVLRGQFPMWGGYILKFQSNCLMRGTAEKQFGVRLLMRHGDQMLVQTLKNGDIRWYRIYTTWDGILFLEGVYWVSERTADPHHDARDVYIGYYATHDCIAARSEKFLEHGKEGVLRFTFRANKKEHEIPSQYIKARRTQAKKERKRK